MRRRSRVSCLAAFLVLVSAKSGLSQTRPAGNIAGIAPAAPTRVDPSYSTAEKDFTVGKKVYLRSSKTHIGSIVAVDPDHAFPPRMGVTRAKGVLIRRKDGPLDWMPLKSALRIYVVK
jgi:hypothetical protein